MIQEWSLDLSSSHSSNALGNAFDQIQNYPVLGNTQYYTEVAQHDPNTVFTSSSDNFDGAGHQRSVEAAPSHNSISTPTNKSDTEFPEPMINTELRGESGSRGTSKAYVCPQEGCSASFKRAYDLTRHKKKHQPPTLHCLEPGCRFHHAHGFYRLDKLVSHQKAKHNLSLKPARWGFSQLRAPSNGVTEVPVSIDKLSATDVMELGTVLKSAHKHFVKLSNNGKRCLWYSEGILEGYNARFPTTKT